MDITIKTYKDIPQHLNIKMLKYSHLDNFKFALFCEILKAYKVNVRAIDRDKLINLFTIVDWTFLEAPPVEPLVASYRPYFFGRELHMPQAKLIDFTCRQFELLETYYSEFTTEQNQESLIHLVNLLSYRAVIHSHEDVIKIKTSHPTWWIRNCILYTQANLTWFSKLYTIALEISPLKQAKSDNLGWISTFMSVAETGVFGNLEKVYETSIHTVMTYLVKKNRESNDIPGANQLS